MGLRRRSREKTLQILYAMEFNKSLTPVTAVEQYYRYFNLPLQKQTDDSAQEEREFVVYLLREVKDKADYIHDLIEKAATNWRIERIALIERNILRFAIAELIDDSNGIPFKATINEAIDIAKKFGNRESPAFINGIVNKVADLANIKQKKA